jgi:hypothetical protein
LKHYNTIPSTAIPLPEGHYRHERLPVPHVFRPLLSVAEASIAVAAMLARIFLGCVFFALWGGGTLIVWSSIPSHFWRVMAMLPMVALFVFQFWLLMRTISAVASAATKWSHPASHR